METGDEDKGNWKVSVMSHLVLCSPYDKAYHLLVKSKVNLNLLPNCKLRTYLNPGCRDYVSV